LPSGWSWLGGCTRATLLLKAWLNCELGIRDWVMLVLGGSLQERKF
jgi:hypothetical protein